MHYLPTLVLLPPLILSLLCVQGGIASSEAERQPLDVPQLMELMAKVTSRQDTFTETKTLSMLTQPLLLPMIRTRWGAYREHYIRQRPYG